MKSWGLVLLEMGLIFGALTEVAGAESRPEGGGPAAPQKQKTAQAIWAGESGGFKICWTEVDIQAHPLKSPNRLAFSARSLAKREFARYVADEKNMASKSDTAKSCTASKSFRWRAPS